ncbi:hypothetical protein FRC00_000680 [Tulasnella sp. 408]|nr:hypothetical protein FRC00_000680 [Tulasnella sp. 408]
MSHSAKTRKKDSAPKWSDHARRPMEELIAELTAKAEAGPLNNFTTVSFDKDKLRNEDLQRELYRDMFVLGQTEDVAEFVKTLPRNGQAIVMGGIWRDRGAALFKEGKLESAREAWKKSIRYSLSEPEDCPLPHATAFIQAMNGTGMDEYNDLIACANNIAQSYIKEEKLSEALDWLNECMCLHKSSGTAKKPSALPWIMVIYPYEEFNILYLKMMMRWESVLWRLGNTSAAYAAILDAINRRENLFRNSDILKADIFEKATKYFDIRHPDPRGVEGVKLVDQELQIRGAWKKLRVLSTSTAPLAPRTGPSTAIYNGRFKSYLINQ